MDAVRTIRAARWAVVCSVLGALGVLASARAEQPERWRQRAADEVAAVEALGERIELYSYLGTLQQQAGDQAGLARTIRAVEQMPDGALAEQRVALLGRLSDAPLAQPPVVDAPPSAEQLRRQRQALLAGPADVRDGLLLELVEQALAAGQTDLAQEIAVGDLEAPVLRVMALARVALAVEDRGTATELIDRAAERLLQLDAASAEAAADAVLDAQLALRQFEPAQRLIDRFPTPARRVALAAAQADAGRVPAARATLDEAWRQWDQQPPPAADRARLAADVAALARRLTQPQLAAAAWSEAVRAAAETEGLMWKIAAYRSLARAEPEQFARLVDTLPSPAERAAACLGAAAL